MIHTVSYKDVSYKKNLHSRPNVRSSISLVYQ